MRIVRLAFGFFNGASSPGFQQFSVVGRTLSTNANSAGRGMDDIEGSNSFESTADFERRIFGDYSGRSPRTDAFFEKLDRLGKGRDSFGPKVDVERNSTALNGLDESFDTLQDGMDVRLEKAATYFEFDPEEISQGDYTFRPDVTFRSGMTYDVKDLDVTKPGVRRPPQRAEFKVTTEEVLRKADFRNVRFLANFLTEAGIIIKRSQTGISAKAQRKVAREIKTARAFGLMPFTTMGTKPFVYGKTMEDLNEDYEYESFGGDVVADPE